MVADTDRRWRTLLITAREINNTVGGGKIGVFLMAIDTEHFRDKLENVDMGKAPSCS